MLSYHFTLFLLSALLVYFVLMCRHRTADVGLLPSLGVQFWPLTMDGGSVLGHRQSLPDASVGSHRRCRNCCEMNWERADLGQTNRPQGDSKRPGRPTQNLNRSTSKGAIPSKFSWVQWLESVARRAFAEIKEWQTSIEKRERAVERWGNKAMGEDKQNK